MRLIRGIGIASITLACITVAILVAILVAFGGEVRAEREEWLATVYLGTVAGPMALALAVIGIGQVRLRPWSFWATKIWGIVALALSVFGILSPFLIPSRHTKSLVGASPLFVLMAIYPAVLLVFFARSTTARALGRHSADDAQPSSPKTGTLG